MHPAILLVLARLRSALGTGETPANSNDNFIVRWYNDVVERIGRGPWCQMTVTWSHFTSLPKKLIRGRAYTVWAAQDFQAGYEGGTWHWGTAGMRAGDIVYYDWQLAGTRAAERVDHVGTVERVLSPTTFAVLEGNTSANRLERKIRDGKYVVGYGRPDWSRSGVQSQAASAKPSLPAPVKTFKRDRGLVMKLQGYLELQQDGDWGPNTDLAAAAMRAAARGGTGSMRLVQKIVDVTTDGVRGRYTDAAIRRWVASFQKYVLGVEGDGEWGPKTDAAYLAFRKANYGKY